MTSCDNTIPIFADESLLKKTVMKIQTNSLEPGEPKDSSECNIFNIFRAISSENEVADFQKRYDDGISWGDAKKALFENLHEFLLPYKSEYTRIIQDRSYIESVLIDGSKKALEISAPLMEEVRTRVGIKGF